MNVLIVTILYFMSDILLGAVILSYWLAYRMKPSIHVLALMFFFIAVLYVHLIATVSNIISTYTESFYKVPYIWSRPLVLAFASAFLFYTTWKKNTKI